MKQILTIFAILATCLALTACKQEREPETTIHTGNGYRVSKLFTHEGCTVYRFYDGNDRYFTKCESQTSATNWQESCGKNCTRAQSISTEPAQ